MNRKKNYLFISLLAATTISNAQITAPDTVAAGTNVTLTANDTGAAYTWTIGNNDLTPVVPPAPTTIMTGGLLSTPSFSVTVNDNDTWYTFVTNYYSGELIRLNHGTAPTNVPTAVDLGNFGMNDGVSGGIDIVKDEASGNWYGFIVNGSNFLRLDFGNSLTNTPTSTLMSFPNTLAWPHEFKIKRFGQKWLGFAANRSLGIAKFDFGTSLTNTPSSIELPLANLSSPVSFSLIEQNNNWYMFVANLDPGSIARLNFGTDINNDTPTSVSLGSFNQLSLTRKIIMVKDCDQLFGYSLDEYSQLYKLDFNNDATNTTPTFSILAPIDYNCFELFSYKNEIRAMMMNTNGNTLKTAAFQTFDANTTFTNYYNHNQTYTFNTPGTYNISLAIDRGAFLDEKTACKSIVVVNASDATSIKTVENKHHAIATFPNPAKDELNLIIPESGNYTFTISNSFGQIVVKESKAMLEKGQVSPIDLTRNNIATGTYYLKVTDGNGNYYLAKFIKEAK